ncbi:ribokinase [Tunturiibacter lichenicola]|uniref:ribokinase n=1 Tax=Tunturiibacter lichenicola TaxID=2051959 RepID=UPI0021B24217|nr:ribokinase [Edaphobacter lichenicola]
MNSKPIAIMGVFAIDLAFRVNRLPVWGETVLGSEFRLGPGGKGSNQSVAAARLGAQVHFISKVGSDNFGDIARRTYKEEGVDTQFLFSSDSETTGAAAIIIDEIKGENAIVITPGAANALTTDEIDLARTKIAGSAVFMTQLELPLPIVIHGLNTAHGLGVSTILNPAPACALDDTTLALCDYLTPNESEAEALTGRRVASLEDAESAADQLLARGVRNVILTLGARGALVKTSSMTVHIEAFNAGPVIDTTGAGDAFNAGLAVALSEGMSLEDAARFGCVVAGISVTRHGTAPSMPRRAELERYKQAYSRR